MSLPFDETKATQAAAAILGVITFFKSAMGI